MEAGSRHSWMATSDALRGACNDPLASPAAALQIKGVGGQEEPPPAPCRRVGSLRVDHHCLDKAARATRPTTGCDRLEQPAHPPPGRRRGRGRTWPFFLGALGRPQILCEDAQLRDRQRAPLLEHPIRAVLPPGNPSDAAAGGPGHRRAVDAQDALRERDRLGKPRRMGRRSANLVEVFEVCVHSSPRAARTPG